MAVQLEEKDCMLDLGWVPRDQNQEADAITNSNLGDFSPENEIVVDLAALDFRVLRELLDLGDVFYDEREQERQAAAGTATTTTSTTTTTAARTSAGKAPKRKKLKASLGRW